MEKSEIFSNVYTIRGTLDDIIVENKRDSLLCLITKKVKSEFLNGVTYLYSSEHATWFVHRGKDMKVLRLSELKLTSSHFEMIRGEEEGCKIIFKTKTLEGEPFEIQTGSVISI